MSLNKTLVLFGLAALAIVMAALFATVPPAGPLEAHERTNRHPCHTEQVPLDEATASPASPNACVCDDF